MPGLKRRFDNSQGENNSDDLTSDDQPIEDRETRKRQRLSADPGSDELTDEETQSFQATQFHQWQSEKHVQINQPQENGIIESITCTNFMCHDYLQVDIGPLVNFIVGHNGSGKSAVLTALTVCLGGKASATNRAGSLKAFVKTGKESCNIAVKIKNQGETAYQPSVYGSTIVVERSFSILGSSGFKLKNSSGRVISTKRSDLEEITDFYALQLDNPVSVLTQDNARQFLNASSPSDKYKFFMKGVQLEQLNQDYELLQENIQQIENTFEEKELNLRALRDRKQNAEANWHALEQADNIRDEIDLQRVKMAWSQVQDQENTLKTLEDNLHDVNLKLEGAQREVQNTTSRLEDADCHRSEVQTKGEQLGLELSAANDEKKEMEQQYNEIKQDTMESVHDVRQIGDRIKRATKSIGESQEAIEEEIERLKQVNGGSLSRRMEELQGLKAKVNVAQKDLDNHKAGLPRLEEMYGNTMKEVDRHTTTRQLKDVELRACEDRLKELQQQGNRRNGYPLRMDVLTKTIAQNEEFRERPIGPIGDFLQLKDPIWSSILERSFGGALNGFVVTNKADQNRLQLIMDEVGCKCPIFIGNQGLIDTSQHEPDNRFLTILRILEISSDLVKHQLVINHNIEQTILIEKPEEARREMHIQRLKNVKQCFSINPDRAGCGVRYSYGQGTNLKSDPIDANKSPPRMKTQIEDQISFEENQRQRLRRDVTETDKTYRLLQKAVDECKKAIARHKKTTETLNVEVQRAENQVDELQTAIDAESVEEGRLDVLRSNLRSVEQEKEQLEGMYEDAVLERDKQHAKLADTNKQLTSKGANIVTIKEEQKSITDSLVNLTDERHRALRAKNAAYDAEQLLKTEQARLQVIRNRTADTITDWSSKAAGIGKRVEILPGETSTSIEQKLAKLDEDIKVNERRAGGDKRKVAQDKRMASKKYEAALSQFRDERKLADLLKQSLATRRERWGYFRKKIVARARCTFLHVLSERSFNGKLKVDHKSRRLEIEIQPDETQKNRGNRETTTLSGGEKSYSTICLLLSLWDAVGAPIRCLDEFDVFMDSVNRDASMRLITKWARKSVGRQFILISPQAGIADRSKDVKIIKMQDPVRDNTRLNITRHT